MNKKVLKIFNNIATQLPATGTVTFRRKWTKAEIAERDKGITQHKENFTKITPVNHVNQIKKVYLETLKEQKRTLTGTEQLDLASIVATTYMSQVIKVTEAQKERHEKQQAAMAEFMKLNAEKAEQDELEVIPAIDGTVFVTKIDEND